jgi:hypothetical protein
MPEKSVNSGIFLIKDLLISQRKCYNKVNNLHTYYDLIIQIFLFIVHLNLLMVS